LDLRLVPEEERVLLRVGCIVFFGIKLNAAAEPFFAAYQPHIYAGNGDARLEADACPVA
jgi:hypothetical protein